MTDNITLNDQEREALEALWRAGGTLDFDTPAREIKDAFCDMRSLLYVIHDDTQPSGLAYRFTEGGLALATELFTSADAELDALRAENARLRKMLYDMTSLSDWYRAGYDSAEYVALNREFDDKLSGQSGEVRNDLD